MTRTAAGIANPSRFLNAARIFAFMSVQPVLEEDRCYERSLLHCKVAARLDLALPRHVELDATERRQVGWRVGLRSRARADEKLELGVACIRRRELFLVACFQDLAEKPCRTGNARRGLERI